MHELHDQSRKALQGLQLQLQSSFVNMIKPPVKPKHLAVVRRLLALGINLIY